MLNIAVQQQAARRLERLMQLCSRLFRQLFNMTPVRATSPAGSPDMPVIQSMTRQRPPTRSSMTLSG